MRTALALLLGLALLVGGVLYGGSLLRRAVLMTTADPDVLGLVASDSRKPVTLGMRATHEHLARSEIDYGNHIHWNEVDHRISFTLPAAYVTMADLKDGPDQQRLGFELWSRSFDPVMPDRLEARRICRDDDCADGPVAKRRASGEEAISVEVTSVLGTEAQRQYVLAGRSGLDRKDTTDAGRPCAIGYDAARALVTIDKPPDVERFTGSCNFTGNGSLYRGEVRSVPRHFAKRNADGSLRYIVRCGEFSDDPRIQTRCQLQGYFGIWPLFVWVRPSRIDEWDGLYGRVSEFLAHHVERRTDLAVGTGPARRSDASGHVHP